MYVYPSHFNCMGVASGLVPRLVLHGPTRRRSKDCAHARAEIDQVPTRRQSMCEKDRARAEMEHKQSKHDRAREWRRKQRNIASEESRAKERVWQILTRYFAHFLKLFRPPLCHLHRYISSPAPRTRTLHMDIYLHISGYFFCMRHTLRMRIPSIEENPDHSVLTSSCIDHSTVGLLRFKVPLIVPGQLHLLHL